MFPVSIPALSHTARTCFSPLLINEVVQSQFPLHLAETPACLPIYSSLTNFVGFFPIILVLFLSSSVRQSKMFSWVYLHSFLTMCSGSFTQLWVKGVFAGKKGVFAFKLSSNIKNTSEQLATTFSIAV